jgi:uncharacterized protein (TIGR04141 family)
MAKKRSFSIYLLKRGFDAANSLKTDNDLIAGVPATRLPEGAQLFLLDPVPYTPWWKPYFGVERELTQAHKGAIVFLPTRDRWCVLAFGHVVHNLKDECYEYDFGLRVTLNCVDPEKLRSTDTIEPGVSRRQRTQLPTGSELTLFDFDQDRAILKKLTGMVKAEYTDDIKHVTGASSLRMSTDAPAEQIAATCARLIGIYEKDDYKRDFPQIRSVEPVKDPIVVRSLEEKLLEAFRGKTTALTIAVPDIINHGEGFSASFSGAGASLTYDDVAMPFYHEYLDSKGVLLAGVDIAFLKKQSLRLCDDSGTTTESFSIYECLLFDTSLAADGPAYHLIDGNWYCIDRDYVAKLKADLDPFFSVTALMPYDHDDEGAYNEAVSAASQDYICLDRTSISPAGQRGGIEPCDLYSVSDGRAVLTHVKVSTRSQQLSHLFNQGLNSIVAVKQIPEAKERLGQVIRERAGGRDAAPFLAPLDEDKFRVVYAIATEKSPKGLSDNLPIFSRMSLRRSIKDLRFAGVPVTCCYIRDVREESTGEPKPRRARRAAPVTVVVGSLRPPKAPVATVAAVVKPMGAPEVADPVEAVVLEE